MYAHSPWLIATIYNMFINSNNVCCKISEKIPLQRNFSTELDEGKFSKVLCIFLKFFYKIKY